MIPKIIHKIWIQGCDKIPDKLIGMHKKCQEINNDFEYLCWSDETIREFLKENYDKSYLELYDQYTVPAQKADFARYAILYIYGGIYLDMDMVCHKNLTPFLKYNVFHAGYRFSDIMKRYLNGIIGTVPRHEVFPFIFNNLFIRRSNMKDVTYSTGTSLFYDSIKEYENATGKNDIMTIDKKYLDPCTIWNKDTCSHECKDCYVAHTSYSSWSKSAAFVKKMINSKYIVLIIFAIIIIILLGGYFGYKYYKSN